jgi:hypothetical protein
MTLVCASMAVEMAEVTEEGREKGRGFTGGREEAEREEEPRSILPASRERRSQSFKRDVGVPSMKACSPLKPDLPFSKTMTASAEVSLETKEGKQKKGKTHAGACRTIGPCHRRPTAPMRCLRE